mmetsp:Transcript_8349/g.25245  ORF Transcript_8349/g.25245 Transcript_8349/m.25245 type:complete len:210 (-) Transcript_8349:367-996(-)
MGPQVALHGVRECLREAHHDVQQLVARQAQILAQKGLGLCHTLWGALQKLGVFEAHGSQAVAVKAHPFQQRQHLGRAALSAAQQLRRERQHSPDGALGHALRRQLKRDAAGVPRGSAEPAAAAAAADAAARSAAGFGRGRRRRGVVVAGSARRVGARGEGQIVFLWRGGVATARMPRPTASRPPSCLRRRSRGRRAIPCAADCSSTQLA